MRLHRRTGWRPEAAPSALVASAALVLAALVVASPAVAADVRPPSGSPAPRVVTTTSQGGGAVLVTTAEVGTLSLSDCRSGYTCLWSAPAYTGTLVQYRLPGQYVALPSFVIGSWANRYERRVTFYETVGGGGHSVCGAPGASVAQASGWSTVARSLYQSSTATSC